MDKINGLNQIVEMLQSRLSKGNKKEKTSTAKSPKSKPEARSSEKQTIEDLEFKISSKFKSLNKQSQGYKQSAVNLFIDEVLAWEFGSNITTDPDFAKLKEKIYNSFRENQKLDEEFDKILSKL